MPLPSCALMLSPQQLTVLSDLTAQLWVMPKPKLTTLVRPLAVGAVRSTAVLSPICPCELAPQHCTAPPAIAAQVWSAPAASAVAPTKPDDATGVVWLTLVPSPSWPFWFRPQHNTAPLTLRTAQVCQSPAAICTASLIPTTCTGVALNPLNPLAVPSPSWPYWLLPQHQTVPFNLIAHE